ncbi:DNA repair protein RadC [Neptuniibacter sp.]|uniref:RadC family protein n=1 Tax=Neptuniibacter sp. TaxID=1962643 RepID=UPI002614E3D4|nr:DNA repair protein RadC [Neptuniibacter sp.]MCP4597831.1 DNA repair protein RadC [Neptuniibacter sp.]
MSVSETDYYSKPHIQSKPTDISDDQVLYWAESIIEKRFMRSNYLSSPNQTREYLKLALSQYEREVFGIILLDNRHAVLDFQLLFQGTIDGAAVYPREVVKAALKLNSAAVILTHNHPSGVAEPSEADKLITRRLITALDTVDIRVLDHLIVGGNQITSFAERGLLTC